MSDLLPASPPLAAFIFASVVLAVAPGPGVVYIVARTLAHGRQAGLASVAGVALGNLGNATGAALGLAALLTVSSLAFNVVRFAGAAYLIWLGIQTLLKPFAPDTASHVMVKAHWRIFRDGFVTNALNPKVAIFFLAFLPQFVDPGAGPGPLPFLLLGAAFVSGGTLWCIVLATCAAAATRAMRGNAGLVAWLHRLAGCVCIALGLSRLRSRSPVG